MNTSDIDDVIIELSDGYRPAEVEFPWAERTQDGD